MLRIYDLKTEYRTNPYGIDAPHPRFSWKLDSDRRGVMQESYRVIVVSGFDILWDSDWVKSGQSQIVRYAGLPLNSMTEAKWMVQVTVKDENGVTETASSDKASFTMGLLDPEDWKCSWIEPAGNFDEEASQPSPMLRRTFDVKNGLRRAYIAQTAHGLYEFWINGKLGTEDKLKPGFTSYYYRLQYQIYDITSLLTEGKNVWAVQLGDGWWRGYCGGIRNSFGTKCQFFGQIVLEYEDGTADTVITDDGFRTSVGALISSDMFMGDVYDASIDDFTWRLPDYDDSNWTPAVLSTDAGNAQLIPTRGVPVREREHFTAHPFKDNIGRLVLDFGQNISGYVKMRLRNTKKGQIVHLTHGETLDHDGNFTQKNIKQGHTLNMPRFQEIIYTCRGDKTEEYCPMFSTQGFRYVLVEGYEIENIKIGDFIAIAVYSDMEDVGDFKCSNELINQLVKNSRWSQKGNFMDVAVDCPTRERNAWTGDNQIYVKTAARFMDVYSFYEKWLQDQAIEQYDSGKVSISFPCTTSPHRLETLEKIKKTNPLAALAGPDGNGSLGEDCAGWGDAAAYLPYIIYLSYGDKQILENQYNTAKKWVDYMLSCASEHNELYTRLPQYHTIGDDGRLDGEYIYDTRMHFGEWQEPLQNQSEVSVTPELVAKMIKMGKPLVATAYMRRSASNVADMARVLGKTDDAEYYAKISERISRVYEKYLISDDGEIEKGHQAAYVRAITMKLCGEKREKVANHLVKEIESNGYLLNTGFLSTPFLLPTLVDIGRTDLAYKILESTDAPSWLHPVLLGATTIPEGWYSLDRCQDSHNHYSFGAVCDFLFGYTAGIRPIWEKAGYEEFELKPVPGGSLTHAAASFNSQYGEIVSSWRLENGDFIYECAVPTNTKAHLTLPNGEYYYLGSGRHKFVISAN